MKEMRNKPKLKYQGELMPVIRHNGSSQMICVYANSSDFPNYDLVTLCENKQQGYPTERVPINEELWRRIGQALGYRFIIRGEKK